MTFLWLAFSSLLWWQMVLWFAYAIYFIVRSWHIWDVVTSFGIRKGYKHVFVGRDKHFRLYHVVRTVLDIPPMIVGLIFPVLKKLLSLKLYTFKDEDKK